MARYAIPAAPPSTTDHTQKMFRLQIGAVLQKHRLRQGLTQVEVAERADLSLKYIGEIERGEANVSVDIVARIADAVGMNQADLMQPVQEPLSEGVRALLVDEVQTMRAQLASILKWLQALDPALNARPVPKRDPQALEPRAPNRRARPSTRS
jgi:transcriptional regulator with XRE-family HTH domain